MRCPACQHEGPAGANYCAVCGARLVLTCAACGTELPETARFCPQCGQSVGRPLPAAPSESTLAGIPSGRYFTEPALDAKNGLEGERKHLTVLFADLKGSMEILADRDPEESRKVLDGVLDRMMEAVQRHEGKVTQVMGDGIMALFGAPLAQEDHALQACRAALAMQEAIGRYSDDVRRSQGVTVQIRVGLHSGEVVVYPIGSESETGRLGYTAVGRVVHVAARMEQAANPGSVLLTSDTLRLVEGFVDVVRLGPIALKGLSELMEAYELKGLGRVRNRLQTAAARGLTRFVGREGDIEVLGRALESAASGYGQIVCVVGEPGVGKSRLLYEFGHSYHTKNWLVLESASASYGRAPPGAPVIDLLKNYLRLEGSVENGELREQLSQKVLSLDQSLEPLVKRILTLFDAPVADPEWNSLDPPQRLRLSLDAFVKLLICESQVQPLVVIFDDLQANDSVTQSFLDDLVVNLPRNRIMLLVGYRPDYQHGWGHKSYYGQLRLDPLSGESADSIAEALVGTDPQLLPLKQHLIARTEGNPFFLEESVRTLVETGVFSGPRGAYRLEKDFQTIQVPATVEAVLAARIDRLAPDEKRLLQSAAVVGKDVPLVMLRSIAEMDEDMLGRGLDRLQAAEFLHVGRLVSSPEYTFKHALTHQVAYQTLLQERRRALHRRIVEAIERGQTNYGVEKIELLAHHALRSESWDKAVRYCRQAGVAAASRPAHREAAARFEQALEALEHLPESRERGELAIDIHFDLRNSLQALGQLQQLLDNIRKVEAQAAFIGDQRRLGQASSFACQYYRLVGDVARAIEAGEQAIGIADELGDVQLAVVARNHLGPALAARGDYRRATQVLIEGVERLGTGSGPDLMGTTGMLSVFSRIYLATSLAELGDFATAMLHAEPAYQIAEAAGHVYSITFACYGIGTIRAIRGEIAESIAALERGLELCRTRNLPVALPLLGASLGHAYCLADRPEEAISLLEEAELQADAMTRMGGHAMLLVRLGEAYLQVQRTDDARQRALLALALARQHTERGLEAYALRLLGKLALNDDPGLEKSEAFYREAIALADELGMRPLLAHCYLDLGQLFRRAGVRTNAVSYSKAAATLFRALDMPYWLERSETQLAFPP